MDAECLRDETPCGAKSAIRAIQPGVAGRQAAPAAAARIALQVLGNTQCKTGTMLARCLPVTHPRAVCPGDIVFVTSRIVARLFLMRPDREMNDAFGYLLAVYAAKYGIGLHAACVQSTHWHGVMSDPYGLLPAFLRDFNRGLANFIKAHRGWRGTVFQSHPNVVQLRTTEAIVEKIGYTLANPVAAGAVRQASEWPGFRSRIADMDGHEVRYTRPTKYFSPDGTMAPSATLCMSLPKQLIAEHGRAQAQKRLERSALEHEEAARREIFTKGWTFSGAKSCLRVSCFRRSKAYEVFGDRTPTFATKGSGMAGFFAAVRELRAFRAAYRTAFEAWRLGVRDVAFPYGTWLMRVVHGARCLPAPS